MSISQQVADATHLSECGRYESALTLLLLAVAASARKCFPKGTKSLEDPAREMSDREAFTLFLGGRIRKLLFGAYGAPDFAPSHFFVAFRGREYNVELILYRYYRCELVHAAELPEGVEFVAADPSANTVATTGSVRLSVSISAGNRMVLNYGWLDLLKAAVTGARCNGAEFGIQHFDLVPKADVEPSVFEQATVARYGITPGRFQIVKHAVRLISPDAVHNSNDVELSGRFAELVKAGALSGGAISGLSSRGLTDQAGRLQAKGIAVLREIASTHLLVRV